MKLQISIKIGHKPKSYYLTAFIRNVKYRFHQNSTVRETHVKFHNNETPKKKITKYEAE